MDIQIQEVRPDYKLIYSELINTKFPEKYLLCNAILCKENLASVDIIKLNDILFGTAKLKSNQNLKAYSKEDISFILEYQKKNKLNNTEMSNIYSISRNTIAKWKKAYNDRDENIKA